MPTDTSDVDHAVANSAREYLMVLASGARPDAALEAAWHDFYQNGNTFIRGIALSQGLRGPEVDDCVQEVWTEVIRRLPATAPQDEDSGYRGWLFVVTRSKAVDIHRRETLRRSPGLESSHYAIPSDADPASQMYRELNYASLLREIARLQSEVSEANAVLLQLRLVEGLGVSEVAHRLGITSQQVWYRHHRLLARLRRRLGNSIQAVGAR